MEKEIAKFPVKYWDGKKEKKEVYEAIDALDPGYKNLVLSGGYDMSHYYKDSEFKDVAEELEAAAKDLRPVLKDIEKHFASGEEYKKTAKYILDKINLDGNANIATLALLIYNALDNTGEGSFINRIKTGNGIPEERAAYRAGKRYQAFKAEEAAKLEAFKNTPEYALQEAEIKFKQREKIELPEE